MDHKDFRLIPALDTTDLSAAARLVSAVGEAQAVYGFKVGFGLGLAHGLPRVVEAIRKSSAKPILYDHQKAGTDIPDTGRLFAETLRGAGVDEAILFPHAGPAVLAAWVAACSEAGLKVIVGGLMTHRGYVRSEGGFLADEAIPEIYRLAHREGVRAFVVPLTKPAATRLLVRELDLGACEFYSPGYGAQGGDPGAFDFIRRHYVIVGRSLLKAPDPLHYVQEVSDALARCP
ncbi:orotidine 5'-phosphate decarboxylase [Candidatus Fermentibacteria bacterium]|nr:orotidine 5'-phosphate decarboxylase [Candidatus Fermentibacteria bacterium]